MTSNGTSRLTAALSAFVIRKLHPRGPCPAALPHPRDVDPSRVRLIISAMYDGQDCRRSLPGPAPPAALHYPFAHAYCQATATPQDARILVLRARAAHVSARRTRPPCGAIPGLPAYGDDTDRCATRGVCGLH
jgi:hypothetical protein